MFIVQLIDVTIPEYMLPPRSRKVSDAKQHAEKGTLYPLKLEYSNGGYILRDGYARYEGAMQHGLTEVAAEIWDGTVNDY